MLSGRLTSESMYLVVINVHNLTIFSSHCIPRPKSNFKILYCNLQTCIHSKYIGPGIMLLNPGAESETCGLCDCTDQSVQSAEQLVLSTIYSECKIGPDFSQYDKGDCTVWQIDFYLRCVRVASPDRVVTGTLGNSAPFILPLLPQSEIE